MVGRIFINNLNYITMTIQEEFEENRNQKLIKFHAVIYNKLNAITQEAGDYDVETFLEIYNGLLKESKEFEESL